MSETPAIRRSPWRHVVRVTVGLLILVVLLVAGAAWYATTPAFENWVRSKLIATLENSTGGHVTLESFRWRLLHLEFEADNLTIHGLEGPNEVPYAHLDRLFVRLKILSFLRPKIALNYLEADRPVFHLIVYPDGTTNQPKPRTPSKGFEATKNEILNLAIARTELRNGMLLFNQRAIPFDLAAKNVGAVVTYSGASGGYLADIEIADLTAERGHSVPVDSELKVRVTFARNSAAIQSLQLRTGDSAIKASGSLRNFNDPHWTARVSGAMDLRELQALSPVAGLDHGTVDVALKAEGTRRLFAVSGTTKITHASYITSAVHLGDVNAEAAVRLTPDEIDVSNMRAHLAEGGDIAGSLRLLHWLPQATSTSAATAKHGRMNRKTEPRPEQGTLRAHVSDLTLLTIMSAVANPRYRDLGFDTAAAGDVTADWTGSASALSVNAKMHLAPPVRPTRGEVPLTGDVDATYLHRTGVVDVRNLQVTTPATHLQVSGSLGVYPLEGPSRIQAVLTTSDMAEFDKTLLALGLSAQSRKGVKAIPIQLHGPATFHGMVTGSLIAPDVKGHLQASNFDVILPSNTPEPSPALKPVRATPSNPPAPVASASPVTIHWDSLTADAEYSPKQIAVAEAKLTRGSTLITATGQLYAHRIGHDQSTIDEHSTVNAKVTVANAAISDLLALTGRNIPVSGRLNLQAQASGALNQLHGHGSLSLKGGSVYAQPYKSVTAEFDIAGQQVAAHNFVLSADGGRLTGSGAYDMAAKRFQFAAQGNEINLAHLQRLQASRYPLAGTLNFEAHGSGTEQQPTVEANVHLLRLSLDGQSIGNIDIAAHTEGDNALMNVAAHLEGAVLQAQARTQLSGDYQTQAHLTLTQIDIEPILRTFNVNAIAGHSSLAATVNLSGPLKQPKRLSGDATLSPFAIALEGVPLHSDGPLHVALNNGMLHLDPLRVTGEDTELRANGSIGVFGAKKAIDLHSSGSVNVKIAQTFSSNLMSSGHVQFNVDAKGTLQQPSFGGQVKFTNVNLAWETFPNGLSQLNGTLAFDQDRLDFKDVTARSGGGLIRVEGFITYQAGIYGDLTATAKDVRVRYPQGISAMADAKIRLQGTRSNLLLSGTATITRFMIESNIDFASLTSSTSGVALPPNPNAFSNHVRLDIHVTSAPSLDFQNAIAKLAGNVNLRVRGTVAEPSVLGRISVTEGSATFAGTKYQLQHGDIYFTNPIRIEPVLDIDATAHIEDYDITIGLHGTPSKLTPTFRSEPPLSEQDIFSLLALGRTQEEQQIYSEEQQQAGVNSTADALLGGALNATVSNRIQKLFGGGSVKIDPTYVSGIGNATARITVEQQISKNVTLTYATNVNSTAEQLIQGEVNITKNLSILAVRDETGVFSMLIKLHRRYR